MAAHRRFARVLYSPGMHKLLCQRRLCFKMKQSCSSSPRWGSAMPAGCAKPSGASSHHQYNLNLVFSSRAQAHALPIWTDSGWGAAMSDKMLYLVSGLTLAASAAAVVLLLSAVLS